GHGLKGYVGHGYRYAPAGSHATATFTLKAPAKGSYDVLVSWQSHPNRGNTVPVSVQSRKVDSTITLNMKKEPAVHNAFGRAGQVDVEKGDKITVTIGTDDAGGLAHADAVLLVPKN
ncbi:MAG TPA: NADH-dependent oxidoreductase, partial [Planctomycetaceae bacterium]|nr:NADH-dependent oxidoreductase [Planctomycetaceae bacterium]